MKLMGILLETTGKYDDSNSPVAYCSALLLLRDYLLDLIPLA
jgi:hypothetical protein